MSNLFAVVGDVHGMLNELQELIKRIEQRHPEAEIIFVGDLVDRGPDSRGVVALVKSMVESGKARCVSGNHERMMVDGIADLGADRHTDNLRMWLGNGGQQAIASYAGRESDLNEHIPWMMALPVKIEFDHHVIVHAGLDPRVSLAEQPEETMLWIRDRFLLHPLMFEKYVIHGHTPTHSIDERHNRCNVDSASCFGGMLSAAVFDKTRRGGPIDKISVPCRSLK